MGEEQMPGGRAGFDMPGKGAFGRDHGGDGDCSIFGRLVVIIGWLGWNWGGTLVFLVCGFWGCLEIH